MKKVLLLLFLSLSLQVQAAPIDSDMRNWQEQNQVENGRYVIEIEDIERVGLHRFTITDFSAQTDWGQSVWVQVCRIAKTMIEISLRVTCQTSLGRSKEVVSRPVLQMQILDKDIQKSFPGCE